MTENQALTESHLDVLKKIGNIGLGNAATALATMVNKRIDMAVPQSKFLALDEVMDLMGGLEEVVRCISLRLEGVCPRTDSYSYFTLIVLYISRLMT